MKKYNKVLTLFLVLVLSLGVFTACNKDDQKATDKKASDNKVEDAKMEYITVEDFQKDLENDKYLILDLRKAEDYKKGHIPGAISADLDVVVSGNDIEKGNEVVKKATEGNDKEIVLVCYSGKKYAQAGTNALKALEADMSKVRTLEGGMKAWTEKFPDTIEK